MDSIPAIIAKSKNIFDNKSVNQIDLFSEDESSQDDILIKPLKIGNLKKDYQKNLKQ